MADYWKSTPKYWCKHCQVYVPDTKLQRTNHEATGRHQSAVRRALRNLHRDHERQERDKEFAKGEVARLNALVAGTDAKAAVGGSGSSSSTAPAPSRSRPPPPPLPPQPAQSSSDAPREQLEQLAELGVSIPDAFRPDLAMAGDWTVTEMRVVEVQEEGGDTKKGAATRSFGVQKRPRDNPGDDNDDDDDGGKVGDRKQQGHSEIEKIDLDTAVQGLFKRPRQWGRGLGDDPGVDLDSLLSSAIAKPAAPAKKTEGGDNADNVHGTNDGPKDESQNDHIKKEDATTTADNGAVGPILAPPPQIKQEADTAAVASGLADAAGHGGGETLAAEPTIVFKKRKAKPGRK
ncbi:hypothetical protein SCUCBS95973_000641 [Sporothrix curviconia]|uniref:U1-type domain-containing protein n=1 Tax=Sporothrix curviconia TaxID=1260050 RepID=A0ABP0ARU6_9PEZI